MKLRAPQAAVATDLRPARQALLGQIAHLEEELSGLQCSSWPRTDVVELGPAGRSSGPRLMTLGDLERARDELAGRVADARRALSERTALEEGNRQLIEEMLLDPGEYRWVRVSNEDIGEPGCKHWHVRPRFGVLGMLMKWWRVRISSGCP